MATTVYCRLGGLGTPSTVYCRLGGLGTPSTVYCRLTTVYCRLGGLGTWLPRCTVGWEGWVRGYHGVL